MEMKVLFLSLLCTFVHAQSWNVGSGINYELTTSILLGESSQFINASVGDVGFQLTGNLRVVPIWKDPTNSRILLISVRPESLKLWIKSRKAPEPEGFVEHSSHVEEIPNDPIILLYADGKILKIFTTYIETLSSLNLKRGLASIFQFSNHNAEVQENDASGLCNVTYKILSPSSIEKVKYNCQKSKRQHSNPILGVKLTSFSRSTYELTESFLPKVILEEEIHEMSLLARPEAKTSVTSHRIVKFLGEFTETPMAGSTYTEVLKKIDSRYMEVSFEAENEKQPCPESGCLTLASALDNSRSAIESGALGTIRSATAFLKLVPLIRNTSAETLSKILKSPSNQDILPQLYDLFGSASSPEAHQAAMKLLRQDDVGSNTERYLWALSMSPFADPEIIKDILKRSEEPIENEKLSETYALTVAAMAKRYNTPSVTEKVKNSLEFALENCSEDECKMRYLRALGNLGSKIVIPTLLKYAKGTNKAMGVIAWKAIATLKHEDITPEIKLLAKKVFLQLEKRSDSSVRTLAFNIILENNPTTEDLQDLLLYLSSQDTMYEVKKYVLQRFEQLSATNVQFRQKYLEALRREFKKIVNYNVLAQKGLSTAFTRSFLQSTGSNGSLVTIQEINSGLLKRGIVDVVLESGPHKYTFLSLGLFAGGLGSFVSSSDSEENEVPAENESATAGMEISFMDVYIRPFIFFSGQGELMGHVWSGTASERTPAFQTIVNLHRHRELVPLGSGFVVEVNVEGAMSVDLAGQIQLSLWSRNAQSLVEMGAGIAIQGSSKIITDFVQSRAEFSLTLEPKLELATDVDFSGPVSLCMRLSQPDTIVKHHVYKVERIPGSRHRLRKTRRLRVLSPARSYLLNKKNNEMCSKVFS